MNNPLALKSSSAERSALVLCAANNYDILTSIANTHHHYVCYFVCDVFSDSSHCSYVGTIKSKRHLK